MTIDQVAEATETAPTIAASAIARNMRRDMTNTFFWNVASVLAGRSRLRGLARSVAFYTIEWRFSP
jgi:hypothetical protein